MASSTSGSRADPTRSAKNIYVPSLPRRGRDSIFVRLTSRRANSSRHLTSQPARSVPGPQKIRDVCEVSPTAASGGGASSPEPAKPHEARLVVVVILDPLAQHDSPVDLRCECRADRGTPVARVARHGPHSLRRRGRGDDGRSGQLGVQELRALPRDLGVREHRLDLRELDRPRRDQGVVHRHHRFAGDLESFAVLSEQVEGHGERSLEGVLDRHERPAHRARLDGGDRVVDRRQSDRFDVGAARRREEGLLGERTLRAEVADAPPSAGAVRGRHRRPACRPRARGGRLRPPPARARVRPGRRVPACRRRVPGRGAGCMR